MVRVFLTRSNLTSYPIVTEKNNIVTISFSHNVPDNDISKSTDIQLNLKEAIYLYNKLETILEDDLEEDLPLKKPIVDFDDEDEEEDVPLHIRRGCSYCQQPGSRNMKGPCNMCPKNMGLDSKVHKNKCKQKGNCRCPDFKTWKKLQDEEDDREVSTHC